MRSLSWQRFTVLMGYASIVFLTVSCVGIPIPTIGGGTASGDSDDSGSGGRGGRGSGTGGKATLKQLASHGVKIAVIASTIQFDGPVKGKAPLVVDFKLAEEGILQVNVEVKKKKHSKTLAFPAEGEKRTVDHTALPVALGQWQVAKLTVTAFDPSGKRPIDFKFFGIGVGDKAVGSTGIYQVTFEPDAILTEEEAQWGFRSRYDFDKANILFYRVEQTKTGEHERLIHGFKSPCLPQRGQLCKGRWDGIDGEGKRSTGQYRVGIKAWQKSGRDRDWIVQSSTKVVELQ